MKKRIIALAAIFTLTLGTIANAEGQIGISGINIPIQKDFVDVNVGDWFYSAAKYAKAEGIFNGNEKGEFSPRSNITKAEMAQILFNIKSKSKSNANSYGVSDKWYKDAMEYALSENIVSSKIKATDYGAGSQVSRAEVFDMMYSFGLSEGFAKEISIDTNALEKFADKSKIQSENINAITWLVTNQILNGQLNNNKLYLNPSASITRAEVATIMQNLNSFTSKVKVVTEGKNLVIYAKATSGTGFVWNVDKPVSEIVNITSSYQTNEAAVQMVGGKGTTVFTISGKKSGTETVTFSYLRPWEGKESTIDSFTYEFTVDKNKNVTYKIK